MSVPLSLSTSLKPAETPLLKPADKALKMPIDRVTELGVLRLIMGAVGEFAITSQVCKTFNSCTPYRDTLKSWIKDPALANFLNQEIPSNLILSEYIPTPLTTESCRSLSDVQCTEVVKWNYQQVRILKDENLLKFWNKAEFEVKFGFLVPMGSIHEKASAIRQWMNAHQAELNTITHLDLSNAGLKVLPPEIGRFANLKRLKLQGNQLASLPETFCKLRNLRVLDLGHNQLEALPESIGNLKQLQMLNLKKNKLPKLPESFGQLKNLGNLVLCDNLLDDLPPTFEDLKNLKVLSLAWNRFTRIPENLIAHQKLKKLYLDGMQLKGLPDDFNRLANLQLLSLGDNLFTTFPRLLVQFEKLTHVILDENPIVFFPEELLTNPGQLKIINLSGTEINEVPLGLKIEIEEEDREVRAILDRDDGDKLVIDLEDTHFGHRLLPPQAEEE